MPARAQSRIPSPGQQDPTPRSSARPSDAYARPLTARGASATPRRDSDSYIPRRAAPNAFKPSHLGSSRVCVKELTLAGMPCNRRTAGPWRSRHCHCICTPRVRACRHVHCDCHSVDLKLNLKACRPLTARESTPPLGARDGNVAASAARPPLKRGLAAQPSAAKAPQPRVRSLLTCAASASFCNLHAEGWTLAPDC